MNGWAYIIVNEEFDDSCCQTVVRTGDSYESVVHQGVSKVHFGWSPRKPRQVEIAYQLAAVNSRWGYGVQPQPQRKQACIRHKIIWTNITKMTYGCT